MKKLIILITAVILSIPAKGQETENNQDTYIIKVQLENLINNKGTTLIALYEKEGFLSRQPLQAGKSEIEEGKAFFTFDNVPPGIYAIVALHDENNNDRMDYGPSGMPEEGWTTSGNSLIMGPPNFEESKFELSDQDIVLKLRF